MNFHLVIDSENICDSYWSQILFSLFSCFKPCDTSCHHEVFFCGDNGGERIMFLHYV